MLVNELKVVNFLTQVVEGARQAGVALEMQLDFKRLQELTETLEGRDPLTPIFDWRESGVSGENAFWIQGSDERGEVVLMQAARIDDLGNKSLAEHIQENRDLMLTPSIKADPRTSVFDGCYYLTEITGRVVYAGETWISPVGPYRGKGLASVCSRMAFGLSLLRWRPDYMYGLTSKMLALKGIAAKYEYYHTHPYGVRWKRKDGEGLIDEWVTWMNARDLADVTRALERPLSSFP